MEVTTKVILNHNFNGITHFNPITRLISIVSNPIKIVIVVIVIVIFVQKH